MYIKSLHYLCTTKLVNKFEIMSNSDKKISDLGAMKALETGESVSFSIKSLTSIRTNASIINATRGKKSLTTKIDREAGTITVSRLA